MTRFMKSEHGQEFSWRGVKYRTVMAPDAAQGAMSMFESISPPLSGPPRHVHDREDESFVVLAGRALFWVEGEWITRGPGDALFVRRGQAHTFAGIGSEPLHHLTVLTPGGFEKYLYEMAAKNFRLPEDLPEINEVSARYGARFIGPPITADDVERHAR